jgi:hypothetical protein
VPTLTRWFLRAAIVNLVAGFALGITLVVPPLAGAAAAWQPAYVHLIVMGWATQMIFGVAYWMFPRRQPLDLAATPWLGWICFATMNLGLVLRVLAEPAIAQRSTTAGAAAAVAAAGLQLLSVVAFAILAWPRVFAR